MSAPNHPAPRFRMTWEVIVRDGVADRSGFLPRSGDIPARSNHPRNPARFTLRRAVEILAEHNSGYAPIEADSCPCVVPRWITVRGTTDAYPGMPDALGVSLHLGEVSAASARRIARLLGVYGLTPARTS